MEIFAVGFLAPGADQEQAGSCGRPPLYASAAMPLVWRQAKVAPHVGCGSLLSVRFACWMSVHVSVVLYNGDWGPGPPMDTRIF